MASGQCAKRPCRCRALARACKTSGFFMTHLLQLVVGIEGMRLHGLVACPDMGWQGEGDGRGLPAVIAAAFERQANRVGMRQVAVQRLNDGGIEFARAIALQQLDPVSYTHLTLPT